MQPHDWLYAVLKISKCFILNLKGPSEMFFSKKDNLSETSDKNLHAPKPVKNPDLAILQGLVHTSAGLSGDAAHGA